MAFEFVVEDGSALPDATSYASLEEASDILSTNPHVADQWNALPVETQEGLLAWASRYLDSRTRWFGRRVSETSGLRWPRAGVIDRDNVQIAETTIPKQLKIATIEMARFLMVEDRSAERDQDGLARLKADVIELEFREGYTLPKVPEHMMYLLAGLGAISTGSGTQFKRIIR